MVKRETRRGCLGESCEWCESGGARRGPFIGRRGRARGWPEVGVPAACTISTAGAAALEACWRAWLCTVERSRACWRAGEGRVCRHRLGNGRIFG
jgi:hypothetical protein